MRTFYVIVVLTRSDTIILVAHPDDDKYGGHGSVAKMVSGSCYICTAGDSTDAQASKMPPDLEGAKPDVIAELVAYLIKPQAYFMTGQL